MPHSIILRSHGGPDVMMWEKIKIKNPSQGEALIKQSRVGLNYIDVYHRTGEYPLNLPSSIGMEGVGIVIDIGEGVKNVKVGDRVGYVMGNPGSYTESRLYPAERLIKLPNYISDDTAAAVLLKGLTVSYLINKTFPVRKGQKVLLHAAAGGVGLIACQWLNRIGVEVIGTVGNDEKVDIARENGCKYPINYSKDEFASKVIDITNGKGVPVVFDGVGKETFDGSLECLSSFGTLVSFGASSGPPPNLYLGSLAKKSLYVTRPSLGPHTQTAKRIKEISEPLFEILKDGLTVEVKRKYPLKEAAKAHNDLQKRKTIGSSIFEV
tara:strand:+ start:916 stop:1884 length:969 start_codon:yes stop_codon:yes gene_type:complete